MVLVDSSIWIEAGRREGALEAKVGLEGLLHEYEALWCGLIRLEVLGAARQQDRQRLDAYFECIPYRAINEPVWELAQHSARRLRDKGVNVPSTDILLAACALSWGCRIYARDQHFEAMAPVLGLRLYKPGYGGKYNPDEAG